VLTRAVPFLALSALLTGQTTAPVGREWPVYGGDAGQQRYSPLGQITPANVRNLRIAWSFDTEETGGLQTNPIVVDGVLYLPTPTHRVIALDAATGALRWRFDSGIPGRGPNRGVTYWRGDSGARIFTGQDQYIYALDAVTGRPVPSFGDAGRVDLREGLGWRGPAAWRQTKQGRVGVGYTCASAPHAIETTCAARRRTFPRLSASPRAVRRTKFLL
jgi:glucose dehydrogenase